MSGDTELTDRAGMATVSGATGRGHGLQMAEVRIEESRGLLKPPSHSGTTDGVGAQRRVNDRLWARKSLVKRYANRTLRPVEAMLFARYATELSGRVLELGCGAGRLTGYLADIAATVHGIDISAAMVDYCRRTYPDVSFGVGDLRDVTRMDRGSFEAVVAGFNVLDVLDDADRRLVLDGIHGVLPVGGLLVMSSHNHAYIPRLADPIQIRGMGFYRAAVTLIRLPMWQLRRRRLRQFERSEARYAIRNDVSEDYMALHYYISREAQVRQLRDHGFDFVECLDLDGRPVEDGDDAPDMSELHYVARRH